jgi:hypothetical protein
MSNIKLNSLETSSTLSSAGSKTVETTLLKLNQHPNNQQLQKPIKEKKHKTSKTGHLVLEMLSQLSLLMMESHQLTQELSFNWLPNNQPSLKLILEKKHKILRTGLPESEMPFQLSPPTIPSQHQTTVLSFNLKPIRKKE